MKTGAIPGCARASRIIAGQEPSIQKCRTGVSPRIDFDHDVSILITAVDAAGIAETELVDLFAATGRILAQPIKADAPLPRFDYSAMTW
jgi:hypothetical protein